jgi:hypothetical protein
MPLSVAVFHPMSVDPDRRPNNVEIAAIRVVDEAPIRGSERRTRTRPTGHRIGCLQVIDPISRTLPVNPVYDRCTVNPAERPFDPFLPF